MEKILKVLKSKKFRISLLLFVVLSLLAMIIYGIIAILPDNNESLYGGRLEGIEKYDVSDQRLELIHDIILEKEFVEKIDSNVRGRIINFIVYVGFETDLLSAKALSEILLEEFSEEEKAFFDLQMFLTTEEESELYPKIGYKSYASTNFVWTN